ncbi:MAG TPA: hypothetical protein VH853_13510 [Polyangia bacterium]|nr:hypothetical protein [Polyangia bacterium]
MAKPMSKDPAPLTERVMPTVPAASVEDSGAQIENLAVREQKARQLQDFKGGGVSIYLGSGVLLVVIVILLILLV